MLLKEIQARTRLAMLFITHDFGIVARMCDRVAVMYAGRIVESGPVRALFKTPRHPYTEALMASVPRMEGARRAPALDRGAAARAASPAAGLSLRAALPLRRAALPHRVPAHVRRRRARTRRPAGGRSHSDRAADPRRGRSPSTSPSRGACSSRATTGAVKAVDGISFTIGREETLALVGESGCGKTTTARLLLRLEQPTTGRVLLDGQDVMPSPADRSASTARRVQAVFQDPWSSLNPRLRVRDTIAEALVVNKRVTPAQARRPRRRGARAGRAARGRRQPLSARVLAAASGSASRSRARSRPIPS